MPRAKKDQLTNEQREHVEMVHESLVKLGYPEREAMRRAMMTVSDVPSRRHSPNEKNARVGAAKPRTRATTREPASAKRRARKGTTTKRLSVRNRIAGRT